MDHHQYASPCTQPACPIPELTPECTDECLVLACDDPDHGNPACLVSNGASSCDSSCVAAAACNDCSGIDDILQCCTDYHSYLTDRKSHDIPPVTHWEFSFPDLLCDCTEDLNSIYTPSPVPQPIRALISDSSISSSPSPSPSLSPFSPQHHAPSPISLQSTPMQPLACMWANCGSVFNTLSDLVGHVNLQHLCAIDTRNHSSIPLVQSQHNPHALSQALFCHWGDCATFPSPSSIPSSSSATSDNDVLSILTEHLMQDHLGVIFPFPPPPLTLQPPPEDAHDTSDAVDQPFIDPPLHDCSGTHVCKWKACTQTFLSCDELTNHIASVHIGGGKAHYECFWEGCHRHGTNGFSSKQKISRHIQSHTGHRPFQCQVCNQNFSEAATLQQHMRRHTQEKPYVCDFPGCGKAFAITGALTIHKRIHNGLRPFKCKFCDKAFSESSNLSKHLRTHTGARPYVCTEEECKKAFARPDQLARHMNVHRRKKDSKG
ncbi:hypothetical protein L210DRAFT_2643774 [Boletus edulis BED1]|uniref:C2H2-type domain-containing protein n=1 Tax=Boletus edulis BED1 TaxID=1328754 RepID=A0AAD4GK57_BOLED|nr:hypothetical protein L210DRAFT_2643774 [Boletus edulis BED1]